MLVPNREGLPRWARVNSIRQGQRFLLLLRACSLRAPRLSLLSTVARLHYYLFSSVAVAVLLKRNQCVSHYSVTAAVPLKGISVFPTAVTTP